MADIIPSPAPPTAGSQVRTLAAQIALDVQAAFAALPKNGKPQPHEHTVLAGTQLGVVSPPLQHYPPPPPSLAIVLLRAL
jgi:hypothetical protein